MRPHGDVLMPVTTAGILRQIRKRGLSSLELLHVYRTPELERLWKQGPSLYCAFARRLIRDGYPTRGFELARRRRTIGCEPMGKLDASHSNSFSRPTGEAAQGPKRPDGRRTSRGCHAAPRSCRSGTTHTASESTSTARMRTR